MADFVQHTNGALALIALRGDSQLQHEAGIQLFFALRNEVVCTYTSFSVFHISNMGCDR